MEGSPLDVGKEGIDTANEFNQIFFLSWNGDIFQRVIEVDLFHGLDTDSAQ